ITSNSWNASGSPGEGREDGQDGMDKSLDNDAEGVWSPDIEQSFQEALAIYPPCGRRKIILSDEGKMYDRCACRGWGGRLSVREAPRGGKHRPPQLQQLHPEELHPNRGGGHKPASISAAPGSPRFPPSSSRRLQDPQHLQEHHPGSPARSPPSPRSLPRGQHPCGGNISSRSLYFPFRMAWRALGVQPHTGSSSEEGAGVPAASAVPVWQDRTIASAKLRLLEYSAFMEVPRDAETYSKHLFVHIGQTNPSYSDPLLEAVDIRQIYDKFPEKKGGLKELYERGPQNSFFLVKFWADLNSTIQDGPGTFYGVSSQYSSAENMTITVSTKVCSFGKQVVEKVETEYARLENGRFVYRIHRSPMCEYMINFIHKLKHLPEKYMMNSVLENFTILQVL
ncbi:Transcriptional enhancer factor TEF-5, partial [Pygoscelis adeliae]